MTLSGRALLAGVIGWPVAHSLSPRLHGFWLERHGIDGAYVPLAVRPENFDQAVRALPKLGFRGANVTVPHKEAALRLSDTLTDRAKRIGAVNTLVFGADGTIAGDNTDGYGFLQNLTGAAPLWRPVGRPAVVLGAGGAARAIVAALLGAGASEVRLVNRTRERAEVLASEIGGAIDVGDWRDLPSMLEGAGLLVNTTTLGMAGQQPLDLDLAPLPDDALVTDIVYVPLETDLLRRARERGLAAVDGLGMLLHQARPGFYAWFGTEPEVDDALRAHVLAGVHS